MPSPALPSVARLWRAALWRADPGIDFARLSDVQASALVLLGDRDAVSLEHAAALQRALPGAQLGVVPGATHGLPIEKPELTNRLMLDFLAAELGALAAH